VARTVDAALGGERARIKWPNDVYLADHKVAGVLVEAQSRAGAAQAALVVGVGLNVAAATFPEGFRVPATSLASEGATVGRAWVAGALLHHLGDVTLQYLDGGLGSLLDAIRARDHLHGRAVMAGGVAGKAVGIGERGELLVEGATGVVPVVSGEVRWS
ncbi:MAG: biotin--[acetyl-CoA-carboxylase] ligase, partial [Myxococcales bacterium]|nr:biotin--[acetyl-CoA-carboxylase] ligase [Myxococcales bacterium]